MADFVRDVQEDFFGAAVAVEAERGRVTHVAARDVGGAVDGEGDAVGHFLAPAWVEGVSMSFSMIVGLRVGLTFTIQPRRIPRFFARIDMHPPLLLVRVYLRPYVVFGIPHPPHPASHCPTQHAEAVCPFATAPSPRLEDGPHVAVSGEALVCTALGVGAPVEFDSRGAAGLFVLSRRSSADGDGGVVADGAFGVVDPFHEGALEPSGRLLSIV